MKTARLEAFSDGVIAIAITIMVLELKVPASSDRISGFRRTMAKHGHAWVPTVTGNFTQESGEAAMRKLLAENPALDGVFVANDLMALGARAKPSLFGKDRRKVDFVLIRSSSGVFSGAP